jgi:hypothetical protein
MPSSRSNRATQRRLVFDNEIVIEEDEQNNASEDNASVQSPPQLERIHTRPPQSERNARKRGTTDPSFQSPAPKLAKKSRVAAVTPEDEEQAEIRKLSKHVPKYLHKNVEYSRKGEAKISAPTIKAFKWICERYVIPNDFEQKREYGPLSGTTYEERVIDAYSVDKLERKESAPDEETRVCTVCADVGHKRDDCPTLI